MFKMSLMMKRNLISVLVLMLLALSLHAQRLSPSVQQLLERSRRVLQEFAQDLPLDTVQVPPVQDTSNALPHIIPVILPAELFIPTDRLIGYEPWVSAPITRPTIHFIPDRKSVV